MVAFLWTVLILHALRLLGSVFLLAKGEDVVFAPKDIAWRAVFGLPLLVWALVLLVRG